VQECPQPPPGPTSHAGGTRTGAPTDRSRSLAIGRAVRGSRPDQCVDHCRCLPVFFIWFHFRQPRRQEPHVPAHSSDHRIGSGLRPRNRRPFVGARHPLRPHFARSSSAGHRWPAARDTSWPTLITSSGRHMMRRPCAAGAERGIDAATAPNGGYTRAGRRLELVTECHPISWADFAPPCRIGRGCHGIGVVSRRAQIAPHARQGMTSSVARSPLPDAKQVPGGIVDCCDLQVASRNGGRMIVPPLAVTLVRVSSTDSTYR
jgi:hypothetical protein